MCPPPASGSPALSGTSACSLAESWRLDSFLWTDNKLTVTLCYTDSAQDLKFNLKKQKLNKTPLSNLFLLIETQEMSVKTHKETYCQKMYFVSV